MAPNFHGGTSKRIVRANDLTNGRIYMRSQLPERSTVFSFSMWKCAIALLCCAFSIEPLFAQNLDWRYYGENLYNTRFADIDQINPVNVNQLKPAWTFRTGINGDPNMSMEMTP